MSAPVLPKTFAKFAYKNLLVPAGTLLLTGISTHCLRLGPWGWLMGVALAVALYLKPSGSSVAPIPALELKARLSLGGKTQLALVVVEGERYLVIHGDGGVQLEKIEIPVHTCRELGSSPWDLEGRTGASRDGWAQ